MEIFLNKNEQKEKNYKSKLKIIADYLSLLMNLNHKIFPM